MVLSGKRGWGRAGSGEARHSANLLTTNFEPEDHTNNISKIVQGVGRLFFLILHTSSTCHENTFWNVTLLPSSGVRKLTYLVGLSQPVMPRYSRVRTSRFRKFEGPPLK